jgi:hypothetical protein
MVDIGLSILKGENKGTETEPARRFALRILEKYGAVDIPDDEFNQWVNTGILPDTVLSEYSRRADETRMRLEMLSNKLLDVTKRLGDETIGVGSVPGLGPRAQNLEEMKRLIEDQVMRLRMDLEEIERKMEVSRKPRE